MVNVVETRPMAKKPVGRPSKPLGEGRAVRLDPALASMAKAVATNKGISTGDYLGELVGPLVRRDYKAMLDVLDKELKGGAE